MTEIIKALPWQFWWAVFVVAMGVYFRLSRDERLGSEQLTELDAHILTLTGEIRHANELLAVIAFEQQADADDAPLSNTSKADDFTAAQWEEVLDAYKVMQQQAAAKSQQPYARFRGVKRDE